MYGPLRPWACLSRWHPRSSYEGLRSKLSSLHDAMRSIFIATRCRAVAETVRVACGGDRSGDPHRRRVDDQPDGGHTDTGLVRQRLSVGKCTPGQNVLVHGIGVASRFMVPVAELLGLYHRFYAPDLTSFGKSEKFSTASREAFELSRLSWGVEVDRNGQREIAAS